MNSFFTHLNPRKYSVCEWEILYYKLLYEKADLNNFKGFQFLRTVLLKKQSYNILINNKAFKKCATRIEAYPRMLKKIIFKVKRSNFLDGTDGLVVTAHISVFCLLDLGR